MPCFNTEAYLHETLKSVLAQTCPDYEVVMVDDCSTDGTADIMRWYEARDPRFRAVFADKNGGPAKTRNLGLKHARGRYIAMLDSDDLWTADALQVRCDLARKYPSAAVIATDFLTFTGEVPSEPFTGHVRKGRLARQVFADNFARGNERLMTSPFEAVARLHFAWVGATLVLRSAMADIGDFDESFIGPEDTLLWLRLARNGSFVFSPAVTAMYRQRPGSIVASYSSPKELHYLSVLDRMMDAPLSRDQRRVIGKLKSECHLVSSYFCRRTGDMAAALTHAKQAIAYGALKPAHWKNLAGIWNEQIRGKAAG